MTSWLHTADVLAIVATFAVSHSTFGEEPVAKPAEALSRSSTGKTKDVIEVPFVVEPVKGNVVRRFKPATEVIPAKPVVVIQQDAKVEILNLQGVAPPRRIVKNGRVLVVNGRERNLIELFIQQHQATVTAELQIVRQVCEDLPRPERAKIKKTVDASLNSIARQFAKNEAASIGPVTMIRQAIIEAAKGQISDIQLLQLQERMAIRAANRKRAALMSVLSRLNDELLLSVDQREGITKAICDAWHDDWEKWLLAEGKMLPALPDQTIKPHLSDEQLQVWSELQKTDNGMSASVFDLGDEEWWQEIGNDSTTLKAH